MDYSINIVIYYKEKLVDPMSSKKPVDQILVVTFVLIVLLLLASFSVYQSKKETTVSLGIVLNCIMILVALTGLQIRYWNHPEDQLAPPINWNQFLFAMVCLQYIAIFIFLTSP